jgi:hypothetical protein
MAGARLLSASLRTDFAERRTAAWRVRRSSSRSEFSEITHHASPAKKYLVLCTFFLHRMRISVFCNMQTRSR